MPARIDETKPKRCAKCGENKLPCEFYCGSKRRDGTYGLQSRCKNCDNAASAESTRKLRKRNPEKYREKNRKYYYGTEAIRRKNDNRFILRRKLAKSRILARECGYEPCTATIDTVMNAFTGKCFVCGVPEMECKQKLCMDHDHNTGEFRGWLCGSCNRAAGLLKESPELILKLAEYVEQGGSICYG